MKHLWHTLALCLLSACSGDATNLAEGGIGGSGFTIGPISAFGSIYVNGVKYDTQHAQISVNGNSASADQLRVGMMVTVEGTQEGSSGVAQAISFAEDVRGQVTALFEDGLMLAGQRIEIDERTLFDGVSDLSAIQIGNLLSVSGLQSDDGALLATFIEYLAATESQTPDAPVRVRGRIVRLDSTTLRFYLNDLVVDYHAVESLPAQIKNADWLEVEGTLRNGILYARTLKNTAPPQPPADAQLGLRGKITRFVSTTEFDLAFRPAQVAADTSYRFGSAADLRTGAELTARGTVNAAGTLVLTEVEFNSAASGRPAPGQFMLGGFLTYHHAQPFSLFGIPLEFPPTALFEDSRHAQFGPGQLNVGDPITASGFLHPTTQHFVVERIKREPSNSPAHLLGYAQLNGANLSIMGVPITITSATRYFTDTLPPNTELTATDFFTQATNARVHAIGQANGNSLIAQQLIVLTTQHPSESGRVR